MRKICRYCNKAMDYDPYFEAFVCTECGKMERIVNIKNSIEETENSAAELTRNILFAFSVE